MSSQIYGAVEYFALGQWNEVIDVSSLLLKHADLNACLFGVDNYAQFAPLFPGRGLPKDVSATLWARCEAFIDETSYPSWVLWSELKCVDWDEVATARDGRITEYVDETREDGAGVRMPSWVADVLEHDAEAMIRIGSSVFVRRVLKRKNCLEGNYFPLVMRLMACLAEDFGDVGVRLTVFFD